MTKPSFEAHDNGKALRIPVRGAAESYTIILSSEFLDDEAGDKATTAERQRWAEKNLDAIVQAAEAKRKGGTINAPFDRVIVRSEY